LTTLEKLTLSDSDVEGDDFSPVFLKKVVKPTPVKAKPKSPYGRVKPTSVKAQIVEAIPVKSILKPPSVKSTSKPPSVKSNTSEPKSLKPPSVKSNAPEPKCVKSTSKPPSIKSNTSGPKTPKLPTLSVLPIPAKPKRKVWGAKDKRDLEAAFFAFNPCTDKDWSRVVEALPVEWTIEQVKEQTKKMKLKPLIRLEKDKASKTTELEKIRQLIPNGKLPNKGTIRREALEEEVMQQLFVKRNDNENFLGSSLDDSDDLFIREAMQNHAIETMQEAEPLNRFVTPSRRAYFPKSVDAYRRPSSIEAINSVGDDFSVPDRSKMKYRLKFRAQQFSHQRGAQPVKTYRNTGFQYDSDSNGEDERFA